MDKGHSIINLLIYLFYIFNLGILYVYKMIRIVDNIYIFNKKCGLKLFSIKCFFLKFFKREFNF